LRLRLRVRLHRHDQLGRRRNAAADDSRPALRVRSAVWRRRDAAGTRGAAEDRQEHPRLDDQRSVAAAQHPGAERPRASRELSRRHQRNRAPHPAHRGAEQQRRAARAARRAGRRARLVLRAREADVRLAGAGVRSGHYTSVLVQDRTRRVGARVPGERRQPAVPPGLAPRRARGTRDAVRADQQVPREPAAVLPRQAEEPQGRRSDAARSDADCLRLADGQLERAQPQTLPADSAGQGRRHAQGWAAHQGAGRHINGERLPHDGRRIEPRP
jgi:hypothetical protein